MLESKQTFRTADTWSGVILLGVIGYLISIGYGRLEGRLLRWRDPVG